MEYATVKIGDREATAKNLPLLNSIIELFFDSSIIGYLTYVNENGFVVVVVVVFIVSLFSLFVCCLFFKARSSSPRLKNAVKCVREGEKNASRLQKKNI